MAVSTNLIQNTRSEKPTGRFYKLKRNHANQGDHNEHHRIAHVINDFIGFALLTVVGVQQQACNRCNQIDRRDYTAQYRSHSSRIDTELLLFLERPHGQCNEQNANAITDIEHAAPKICAEGSCHLVQQIVALETLETILEPEHKQSDQHSVNCIAY